MNLYVVLRGLLQCKESGLSSQKEEKEWWLEIAKKRRRYFEHFDDAYFMSK